MVVRVGLVAAQLRSRPRRTLRRAPPQLSARSALCAEENTTNATCVSWLSSFVRCRRVTAPHSVSKKLHTSADCRASPCQAQRARTHAPATSRAVLRRRTSTPRSMLVTYTVRLHRSCSSSVRGSSDAFTGTIAVLERTTLME